MKKQRIVIIFAIALLIVVAWFSQGSSVVSNRINYSSYIDTADNYLEKGLYQKAYLQYEKALNVKKSKDVTDKWLSAYKKAFDDGVINKATYSSALVKSCELYPDNADYWENMISFYLDNSDLNSAYDAYKKSVRKGASSKKLTSLGLKISYSYQTVSSGFSSVARNKNGYFTACDVYEKWGLLDPAGSTVIEFSYDYISPVNSNEEALYRTEDHTRIIDKNGIVQAIVPKSENMERTRALNNGIIARCTSKGNWEFYDCNNNKVILKNYDNVSAFDHGVAAVKKGKKWSLINEKGDSIAKVTFDDIKMYDNGEFVFSDDSFIGSVDGKYGIYSLAGKKLASIPGEKCDGYYGGYIAYQNGDGKWGYVNEKGDVVIKPQYDDANSFSCGLASVKKKGKWGFVDVNNNLVIDYSFVDAGYFTSQGACSVSMYKGQYNIIKLRFGL